jgi:hypothetical protein
MSTEYRRLVGHQVGQKEVPRRAPFGDDELPYLAVLAASQGSLENARDVEEKNLSDDERDALIRSRQNSMRTMLHMMQKDGSCCSGPRDRKIIENTLAMANDTGALFSIEAVGSYVKEKISARRFPSAVDPEQRIRLLGDTPEDILAHFLNSDMDVVYRRAWFLTSGGAQMIFEDVFESEDTSSPKKEGSSEYASYVHGVIVGIGSDLKRYCEDMQK